jgi:tryptophan 2,3-dioxygenase
MIIVEDLLLSHLQALDSMSPEGFLEFRDPLNPASGSSPSSSARLSS